MCLGAASPLGSPRAVPEDGENGEGIGRRGIRENWEHAGEQKTGGKQEQSMGVGSLGNQGEQGNGGTDEQKR